MRRLIIPSSFLLYTIVLISRVYALEFLEKRECTVESLTRPPVHTTCIIDGGMQGGTIDVSVRTPDGEKYALEGPIDGEEGVKFLLQHSQLLTVTISTPI